MKKILLTFSVLAMAYYSQAQNAPLFLWGTGLDGSTYQKTAIYSDIKYGLLFEAALDATGVKVPITFNWRGGGTPALKITSNSNVGIGTTNPLCSLDLSNAGVY